LFLALFVELGRTIFEKFDKRSKMIGIGGFSKLSWNTLFQGELAKQGLLLILTAAHSVSFLITIG